MEGKSIIDFSPPFDLTIVNTVEFAKYSLALFHYERAYI
jgi:hypothetical protein